MPHKWEDAFKLDKVSWGCRTDVRDDELVQLHELLRTVVSVVSCGGKPNNFKFMYYFLYLQINLIIHCDF